MKLLLGTILIAATAFGQYGNPRSSDPYGRPWRGSTPRYDTPRYDAYTSTQRQVERLQQEIRFLGERAAWDGWARRRFRDAVGDLERFQASLSRGNFDRRQLSGAIDNLNRLLTAPELYPREKALLARAREQLFALQNSSQIGGYNRR